MAYKLIAFDLDETALKSDGEMSQRLKTACQRAADAGLIVVISSGRIFRSTKKFSDFLGVDAPVINCQGAAISNSITGETIYSRPLEPHQLREGVEVMRSLGLFVQANTDRDFYADTPSEYFDYYGDKQGFKGILVDDLAELSPMPLKLIGMAEPPVIESSYIKAEAHFGDRMAVTISAPIMLEFTHPEATKGNALDFLCNHFGIEPSEMIAVGDSLNDLAMIEYAGLGVAVANAREEVLKAANYIAPSNDDDGVAFVIEKFMLGE